MAREGTREVLRAGAYHELCAEILFCRKQGLRAMNREALIEEGLCPSSRPLPCWQSDETLTCGMN